MKQSVSPWLLLVLLLLGSGCAARPARVAPAPPVPLAAPAVGTLPGQPQAPAETPEAPAPSQPVTENQTFVTLEGVPRYKIGSGDILEILLARGLIQEKQTVAVRANGMVTVSFVEAKVAGLTTEQAAEEIRRILSPFFKQVSVEVLVKEYNSKKVTVLGALAGKVGAFPLKGKTTFLDLLVEAGGAAPNAALERVRVVRQDGSSVTLNLFRLIEDPLAQAFVLDAGDFVFIPSQRPAAAEEKVAEERKVFILGEVRNPGAFPLLPNMRLSQALALAGGTTEVAVLESARIVRGGLSNPQIVQADFRKVLEQGDQTQDLPLQANDLIVLPRSGIGNWNAFIAKIRPSLEFLTFPLQPATQLLILRDFLQRRD